VENLTKYVLGVAAKSNVEKRQVGCVITLDGEIVAEGFNDNSEHAEVAACRDMCANSLDIDSGLEYVAHVTHQPCPDCAKQLMDYGITKVEVVEAFMKFDSDKVRFDLIDPGFALQVLKFDYMRIDYEGSEQPTPALSTLKKSLYAWSVDGTMQVTQGQINPWHKVVGDLLGQYDNFYVMEEALAKVLTFGARKYKPNNWKECSDTGRYLAAAHRHLNAKITGEDNDPETGLPHLDHMLCNLMFLHVLGLK